MEKCKTWLKWFLQTSMIVGIPVTALGVLLFIQYATFTFTCYSAGYYCEYAFGADRTAEAIQALLDANPGKDMYMKPRK